MSINYVDGSQRIAGLHVCDHYLHIAIKYTREHKRNVRKAFAV